MESLQLKGVTIPSYEPDQTPPVPPKPRKAQVLVKPVSESSNKIKKSNKKTKTKRKNSKNTDKNIRISYHEYKGMTCRRRSQEENAKMVKNGENLGTAEDEKDAKVIKSTKLVKVKKFPKMKKYVVTKDTEKKKLVNVKHCPSCAAFMKMSSKGLCKKCRAKKNEGKKANQTSKKMKSKTSAPKKKKISPQKQMIVLENDELQSAKELKQELLDEINSQISINAEDYYVSLDDIQKVINKRNSL